MDISVVIPTYNRAKSIGAAVESVLSQLGQSDELILVDDGSQDDTAAVAAARWGGDSRVRFIRQENAGVGVARNTGIAAARGGYIALLDSDDLWMPWTLELMRGAIEAHSRPAVVAGSQFVFRSEQELEGGRARRGSTRQEHFPTTRDLFARVVSLPVTGAIFRADVLKGSGGFVTERVNAEDSDLLLRISSSPGCVYIFEPPLYAVGRVGEQARTGLSMDPDKIHRGMRMMLQRERAGMYGGAEGRSLRRAYIAACIRSATVALADLGAAGRGWDLYRRTLGMNAGLGRWRFIVAAPLLLTRSMVRGRRAAG